LLYASEQRVGTGRDGQTNGQTRAGLTAQGRADRFISATESIGRTAVWSSKSRQALAKDSSRTPGLRAEEAPDCHHEPNGLAEARQVGKGTVVTPVNAVRPRPTDRARRRRGGGLQRERERAGLDAALIQPTRYGTPEELQRNQRRTSVRAWNATWLNLAR
jgi:hypothetical protein